MLHDPTDETHRKPRQLRNTPLKKYIRLTSLAITLYYAGIMYISWRRHCNDPKVLSEYEALLTEDKQLIQDYIPFPRLTSTIQKLFNRQQTESESEVEPKDTQANVSIVKHT